MEVACVGFDVSVSVTGIEMYFENKWLLLLAAVLAVLLEIWLARGERWWPFCASRWRSGWPAGKNGGLG